MTQLSIELPVCRQCLQIGKLAQSSGITFWCRGPTGDRHTKTKMVIVKFEEVVGSDREATHTDGKTSRIKVGRPRKPFKETVPGRLMEELEKAPGDRQDLARRIHSSADTVTVALTALKKDGKVVNEGGQWQLS